MSHHIKNSKLSQKGRFFLQIKFVAYKTPPKVKGWGEISALTFFALRMLTITFLGCSLKCFCVREIQSSHGRRVDTQTYKNLKGWKFAFLLSLSCPPFTISCNYQSVIASLYLRLWKRHDNFLLSILNSKWVNMFQCPTNEMIKKGQNSFFDKHVSRITQRPHIKFEFTRIKFLFFTFLFLFSVKVVRKVWKFFALQVWLTE